MVRPSQSWRRIQTIKLIEGVIKGELLNACSFYVSSKKMFMFCPVQVKPPNWGTVHLFSLLHTQPLALSCLSLSFFLVFLIDGNYATLAQKRYRVFHAKVKTVRYIMCHGVLIRRRTDKQDKVMDKNYERRYWIGQNSETT